MFFLNEEDEEDEEEIIQNEEITFQKISNTNIKTSSNPLFKDIYEETSKIYTYFEEKINKFQEIFEQNLTNLDATINYLELLAIPIKCKCSEIIDFIPGWKCLDCSESDSIYCSNCYIKSKNIHKGHKVHYLPKTEKTTGRCDCGDSDNLKSFCPEHKESFKDIKEIDEFIEKTFSKNILSKLNLFFDDLFLKFSKYLALIEQCTFFRWDKLLFDTHNSEEKKDISLIKENFCIVFQNFLTFIYNLTYKNIGMLYLVTKYMLQNFLSDNTEEKYKVSHTCIKLENKKIEIIKEKESDNNKHNCKCSFLRLLLSNWNDKVNNETINQNRKLLLLFTNNIFVKESFSLFYFFMFKE